MRNVIAFFTRNIYKYFGRFFVPVLINNSQRTRVLIVNENTKKILLGKDWLSEQRWRCIGGGVKKGERVIDGAIREVREETGIEVPQRDISFSAIVKQNDLNASYDAHYFICTTTQEKVRRQLHEIYDLAWFDIDKLPDDIDDYTKLFIDTHKID